MSVGFNSDDKAMVKITNIFWQWQSPHTRILCQCRSGQYKLWAPGSNVKCIASPMHMFLPEDKASNSTGVLQKRRKMLEVGGGGAGCRSVEARSVRHRAHGKTGNWKLKRTRKRTAETEIPKQLSHSTVLCLNQLLVPLPRVLTFTCLI